MWCWLEQQDAWWKRATITPAQHINPWDMNNASRFWKDLATLKNILSSTVKFQVGQGDNILFWHDNWAQGILKYEFPHLFAIITDPDASIASQHVDGC
jgi:hypothetical protein